MISEFSLFVSSVEGRTVERFGTRELIGAKRVFDPPLKPDEDASKRKRVTKWFPERIVSITAVEHQRYDAEYRGAIADGGLKAHKREEWEAQIEKDLAAEKATREAAEKLAKDKAKAADTK